ncbi:MAG TPA: hypothetical protein VE596_02175 [Gaiellaceae bacterium]|jgi:hypothetical protein|nr:hypothetical protein [Gaiellaceae bacterium]
MIYRPAGRPGVYSRGGFPCVALVLGVLALAVALVAPTASSARSDGPHFAPDYKISHSMSSNWAGALKRARLASAEAIAEAPSASGGVLP